MLNDEFRAVIEYPKDICACSIIVRMLEGLGYRFRYATEGLELKDYEFSPGCKCMSIGKIMTHIWGLMNWVCLNVIEEKRECPDNFVTGREQIFEMILRLRKHFKTIDDAQLSDITIEGKSFWHLINGPLSDALTHVGQINVFRRLAGNPPVNSCVFTMNAP